MAADGRTVEGTQATARPRADRQGGRRDPGAPHLRTTRPEHVVSLPHWGSFRTPRGYDYLRLGRLQTVGYWAFRVVLDVVSWVVTRLFLGLKVRGRRYLRQVRGGFVSVSNHVQTLDCGMVLQALRGHRAYIVSIEENFSLAWVGKIVRWAGAVPLPERLDTLSEQVRAMGEALRRGSVVHVYPEGVLLPYHRGLQPFGAGAFHLAADNGVPVVPLAIRQRARRGLWRVLKRKPCFTLEVLPPLYPDDSLGRRDAARDLSERCWQEMDGVLA